MNKYFHLEDYESTIATYNPFGMVQYFGRPLCFNSLDAAYFYLFRSLLTQFPKGYIDLVVFIHENTHCKNMDARSFVKSLEKLGIKDVSIVPLHESSAVLENYFENLCIALHSITESKYDRAFFLDALQRYYNYLEIIKEKKNDT